MQTIVELDSFVRSAKAIMSDEERSDILLFLAENPLAGVELGGGLRKVRVARRGSGKSGGFRTVYVFGGTHMPLIAVDVFAKSDKANISRAEQAELVKLSKQLVASYGGGNG